jgi:TFIIF-interacting CTD phosphatase-like protein
MCALRRVTLVLDLDETLVHSSFISMHGEEAHQVEIDMGGSQHTVRGQEKNSR